MSAGVIVLVTALAVASGLGLLWRRSNGHFRGAASTAGLTSHDVRPRWRTA